MATTGVSLDGFTLFPTTPAGGRVSGLQVEGWLSGSNDRARNKRTGAHGSWSSTGRRAQKPIEVAGIITYSSAATAAEERRAMLALGGYGKTPLVVTDALGTLGISVELDDADVPPAADRIIRFHYELVAVDPFARATSPVTESVAAGTSPTFTAAGTTAAEIEVTTTSSGTVDLTLNGQRLRWGSVPSGTVLTSGPGFTNPKRTAVGPSGQNLFGLIVQPMQWPAVVPGSNTPANAGTANLSIKYYPTYS